MTKTLTSIALILVIVGGLNWGLVGLCNFNLVTALVGKFPIIEKAVYVLVGLSAVAVLIDFIKRRAS